MTHNEKNLVAVIEECQSILGDYLQAPVEFMNQRRVTTVDKLLSLLDNRSVVQMIKEIKSQEAEKFKPFNFSHLNKPITMDMTDSSEENFSGNRFEPEKKFDFHLVASGVKRIIAGIGDDCNREGVKETPNRVASMYQEILNGYDEIIDIEKYVKLFPEPHSGMVVVNKIPFYSFCEHHMLPFFGNLSIGYIPKDDGGVLGLSKLVRIARLFAKRLQVQEKLTSEIAGAINTHVPNKGVAVRLEAEHMCMSIRGVRTPGAKTVTTKLIGLFDEDDKTRNEFLEAIK